MTLKLAVFDVDGTLVDSRRSIARAMGAAFEAVGLEDPGYERTRAIVGLSLVDACDGLAPPDLAPETKARLIEAYKEAFIRHRGQPDHHEPLYAGAQETLHRLAADDWLLAVATGKARRGLKALFAAHPIEQYFTTLWCSDDGPGKPHPHMVLEAMRATGVEAEATVVIGDTAHDMAMARAAETQAFGVTWGFHTGEEIAAAGAHAVFDDFDALNAALDAFAAERAP